MTRRNSQTPHANGGHHVIAALLALVLPPLVLSAAFFVLRGSQPVMDFAAAHVSAPVRTFLGRVTGALPRVSVMEILVTALALFGVYYIIKTVVLIIVSREKLATFLHRFTVLACVAAYIWCAFLWLWCVNYTAAPFYRDSGVSPDAITLTQLTDATRYFADGANRTSGNVKRDADGHFAEDTRDMLTRSKWVYNNLTDEFPALAGDSAAPKPMLYSRAMSFFGYTGIYFALTGEANLNTAAPPCLIPATAAHELAHSRGVAAEQEANFAGIAACITSELPVYEYSGYLMGLIYLSGALYDESPDAYFAIADTYNDDVRRDLIDNATYWETAESDGVAAAAVTAMYDGFLRTNGQPLGVKSYGACVDLLVSWVGSRD
jgi:hypothetical protein